VISCNQTQNKNIKHELKYMMNDSFISSLTTFGSYRENLNTT
jgi:hypothetical protein